MKQVTLQCPRCGRQITFTAPAWPVDDEGTIHGRGCLPCLLAEPARRPLPVMHTVEVRDLVPLEILVEHPPAGEEGGAA